ncbi:hypothetical protein D3C77_454220 [compost metagenome]
MKSLSGFGLFGITQAVSVTSSFRASAVELFLSVEAAVLLFWFPEFLLFSLLPQADKTMLIIIRIDNRIRLKRFLLIFFPPVFFNKNTLANAVVH